MDEVPPILCENQQNQISTADAGRREYENQSHRLLGGSRESTTIKNR